MSDKLRLKDYLGFAKPASTGTRSDAGRRIVRVGRHWAIAVNWKIVGAIGLALLLWALIVAVLASI